MSVIDLKGKCCSICDPHILKILGDLLLNNRKQMFLGAL